MSPSLDRIESDPKLPASADVVVIGGGIIGIASAYFLARKGLKVAVVEKGHVGAEQSSRNWGWCRVQGKALAEVPLAKASLAIWDRLAGEIGHDLGFKRSGILLVTKDPAELANWESWTEKARDFQIPGRILNSQEVAEMRPSAEPWLAGWHSPTDGRAEPSRAAPALALGARALGVTIHQGCAARGLETGGGAVSGVITEHGSIRANRVLLAGGAWASMFCRRHGIDFPQAGVYASACRTSVGPRVTEGAIGSDGFSIRMRDDGGYTVSQRGRGRVELTPQGLLYARQFLPMLMKRRKNVTFGIARSATDGPGGLARWAFDGISPFERMRVLDPEPDMALIDRMMNQFRAAYPELRDLKVEQAWGGVIDWTPDSVPVISPIESLRGFFMAAGLCGIGFGLGPGAGQLAADIVAGDTPVVDPTPYRHARLLRR